MIEATPEETIAAVHALRAAGSAETILSDSDKERAAMKRKMSKAMDIENMKDDPVWFKQHREDTKYKQWQDGMFVMLEDLECDYELGVVENSLRDSVYFKVAGYLYFEAGEASLGVNFNSAGSWHLKGRTKLTRAQALYIATGDTNI